MSKKKPFEHEIAPELLAEIEEWEQQEHDEPEGYFFSNPDPYLKHAPLPPDHPKHTFWFDVNFVATSPSARGKKSTFTGNEAHSRGHEVHREQRGF
ncbi:hypothetical protein, partial [Pseudoflavonifractor sp. HCP28S3_F10]|uniref:hypothetical protein n=1 Tax=Pseudoflavonifractor sp. HCP28S3_F10 TaxID=3438947 RepID=UPI003F887B57